ncbi:hypothetical protein C8R41DRAFT_870794 [Lentinula lateritia]|uniref:Uncharacterized protein n=1 Tax=Lentinula lateritia TaxID=40482 RepID=A0ABQ8V2E1_9AGAR|nr:hypothetical protein C8R41DRAFT_870794 [Lentinula lateritia]
MFSKKRGGTKVDCQEFLSELPVKVVQRAHLQGNTTLRLREGAELVNETTCTRRNVYVVSPHWAGPGPDQDRIAGCLLLAVSRWYHNHLESLLPVPYLQAQIQATSDQFDTPRLEMTKVDRPDRIDILADAGVLHDGQRERICTTNECNEGLRESYYLTSELWVVTSGQERPGCRKNLNALREITMWNRRCTVERF